MTAPPSGGSYAQQDGLPVSWTTGAAVSSGEFAVWADSGSGWYIGKLVPNNGTAAYSTSVTLDVPVGSSYRIVVGYRPTVGNGAFTAFACNPGPFAVTAGVPALTITVPTITGTYIAPNASLPVSWTTSAAVGAGEFAVWADSGSGWYIGKLVPNNGTAPTPPASRSTCRRPHLPDPGRLQTHGGGRSIHGVRSERQGPSS